MKYILNIHILYLYSISIYIMHAIFYKIYYDSYTKTKIATMIVDSYLVAN